tara:strand:+ start:5799 stop:7673 length:1875 start_codon:yes stop_codon:yes gene_type:complete
LAHTVIKHSQRKDIQGLRALAVLSVVIFHISPANLKGGYLGVDVFFVISGYLIIGQIWRGLESNEFSFTNFYSKRFRRLFPSFAVVAIVTTLFAYMMMLPVEYKTYIHSLLASSLYVSNYWFYSQSGYFANALEFAPLLHTWSLSVEEQFYLIFPFIMYVVYKKFIATRAVILSLAVVAGISLIASEIALHYDASLSFYFAPTRFWQFVLGGLVSILAIQATSKRVSEICTLIGLTVLLVCFFLFNKTTPFPGIYALPTSLATALIIYAYPRKGLGALILNNKLATYIGNISYSLYLWHWPVIVFYKLYNIDNLSCFEKLMLLGICLLLADLTYRFVENRFRGNRYTQNPNSVIGLSLAASLVLICSTIITTPLHSNKFSAKETYLESFLDYDKSHYRRDICFLTTSSNDFKFYNQDFCINAVENKRNILLIGDSHSAMWYEAMSSKLKDNETLTQVSASGCWPVIPPTGEKRCKDLMQWAFDDLINQVEFEKIIIAGRWRKQQLKKLESTIELLKNKTNSIEFLGPIMEYNTDLPRLLISYQAEQSKIFEHSLYFEKQALDKQFSKTISETSATYISLFNTLCELGTCTLMTEQGIPVQFDYGHLTLEGSEMLLDKIYPSGLL